MTGVFDLYGPAELAEMTAAGVGECPARPEPLPPEGSFFRPGPHDAGFVETLAGVYERRGFPKCAATVRELNREQMS